MKKILYSCILMLSLLFLAGCKHGDSIKIADGEYYLYFLNNHETKLVKETYKPKSTDKAGIVEELLVALHDGPKDVANKKAIPDNVNLPSCIYQNNNQLQLQFDATYRELTGVEELLRRAAIVKTLCQVEGIKDIEFYVEGVTLMDADGKPIGVMSASTFIESSNYEQQQKIVLYFSDKRMKVLQSVDAIASYDGSTPLEKIIIKQLIAGPDKIEDLDMEMLATVPSGTECNNITTVDNICYVDLSKEFMNKIDGMNDELIVYSIVNSLVSLPNINKVKFTIDGESVKSYGTVVNFDQFFEKNFNVVTDTE